MVLEKILGSPLDCKEIQPVHSKGDQSWVFIGRSDAKAETPIFWAHHVNIGKVLVMAFRRFYIFRPFIFFTLRFIVEREIL